MRRKAKRTSGRSRREFVRDLGLSSAVLPMVCNLPSLNAADAKKGARKKRMVVMFSPNGIVPTEFWPAVNGDQFELKKILSPLTPYQDRTLILKGVSDKVRGDGDSHMRGMSCLLTGKELFPGNIQGGSHTPAGWASGLSVDQAIKIHLQSQEETRTRFGSLEFGVNVSDRADPWTRMVYGGPNQPIAPIDDPYQMFAKLYGKTQDKEDVKSVLDDVKDELRKARDLVSAEDRHVLEEHESFVRQMEQELNAKQEQLVQEPPNQPQGIRNKNENMPTISKMQIDMMVNSFVNDMTRIATLQYTKSVGQARMSWLDIKDSHHTLSHKPDAETDAQDKLVKINTWYCEQMAYLVGRLAETPEPDGNGSLLDNTTVIWSNELGKGNSHTLDNIPFVLVGNGMDFKMGRSLEYKNVPHNRLLLAFANAMGYEIDSFGNPNFCGDGVLSDLT